MKKVIPFCEKYFVPLAQKIPGNRATRILCLRHNTPMAKFRRPARDEISVAGELCLLFLRPARDEISVGGNMGCSKYRWIVFFESCK
jgi:hypothetical protein